MQGRCAKVAEEQRPLGKACGGHRPGSAWLRPVQETSWPGKQDGRLPSEPRAPRCRGRKTQNSSCPPPAPCPLPPARPLPAVQRPPTPRRCPQMGTSTSKPASSGLPTDPSLQKGKAEVQGGEVGTCGIPAVCRGGAQSKSFQLQARGAFRIGGRGRRSRLWGFSHLLAKLPSEWI